MILLFYSFLSIYIFFFFHFNDNPKVIQAFVQSDEMGFWSYFSIKKKKRRRRRWTYSWIQQMDVSWKIDIFILFLFFLLEIKMIILISERRGWKSNINGNWYYWIYFIGHYLFYYLWVSVLFHIFLGWIFNLNSI